MLKSSRSLTITVLTGAVSVCNSVHLIHMWLLRFSAALISTEQICNSQRNPFCSVTQQGFSQGQEIKVSDKMFFFTPRFQDLSSTLVTLKSELNVTTKSGQHFSSFPASIEANKLRCVIRL